MPTPPADPVRRVRKLRYRQLDVLDSLQRLALQTAHDLAEELGCSVDAARDTLNRCARHGLVERTRAPPLQIGRGSSRIAWAITPAGLAELALRIDAGRAPGVSMRARTRARLDALYVTPRLRHLLRSLGSRRARSRDLADRLARPLWSIRDDLKRLRAAGLAVCASLRWWSATPAGRAATRKTPRVTP